MTHDFSDLYPKTLEMLRTTYPIQIAQDITGVQPMLNQDQTKVRAQRWHEGIAERKWFINVVSWFSRKSTATLIRQLIFERMKKAEINYTVEIDPATRYHIVVFSTDADEARFLFMHDELLTVDTNEVNTST